MRAQPVVNRTLLASIGVVLLGAGSLALAGALDLYRRWDLPRPAQWIPTDPHEALGSAARHTGFTTWPWAWPVTVTALTLVLLLGLIWLLRQLPGATPRNVPLGGSAPRGGIAVHGSALARAIRDQILAVPGVQHVRVRLTGPGTRPRLHLTVVLTETARPREVLHALQAGPVNHARASTYWAHLPVEIQFSTASRRSRRAHGSRRTAALHSGPWPQP
jgi:hypothetical protein